MGWLESHRSSATCCQLLRQKDMDPHHLYDHKDQSSAFADQLQPTHQIPQNVSKREYIDVLHVKQDSQLQAIATLQQQVADLNEDIMVLKDQHANQQAEQKQSYEAEIQQLQKHAFQDIKESRFQPDDDTTIATRLVRIQDGITAFAKTYALNSSDGLRSQPERLLTELRKALNDGGIASIPSTDSFLEVIDIRHSARLCLTGLLSCAIHSIAFDNPFFFMSDGLQDRFDALPDTYQDLLDRDDPSNTFRKAFDTIEEGT